MVVLSVLRPSFQWGRALTRLSSQILTFSKSPKLANNAVVMRQMSGQRTLEITPSRFEWERFKDDAHYFFFLGLVPMGIMIFCVNVFIGPAELSDIPEGYEPRHWEYYESPIVRFMSKHLYAPPEKAYEVTLHVLNESNEKRKLNMLEMKVKNLMYQKLDYKAWYHLPVDKHRIDKAKEQKDYIDEVHGTR